MDFDQKAPPEPLPPIHDKGSARFFVPELVWAIGGMGLFGFFSMIQRLIMGSDYLAPRGFLVPAVVGFMLIGFLAFIIRSRQKLLVSRLRKERADTDSLRAEVSRREAAELALRDSESELRAILKNMQDSYFRTDAKGYLSTLSDSVHTLTGRYPEELNTSTLTDLFLESEDRERFNKMLERAGRVYGFEARIKHKSGKIVWASINAQFCPTLKESGPIVEGTCRDVTDSKMLSDELKSLNEVLEKRVHLRTRELTEEIAERKRAEEAAAGASQAKSAFLAHMSHELRTPLNAIIGFSDALLNGIKGEIANQGQTTYLEDIKTSGGHLLSLINDILDVSMIEAGELALNEEAFDPSDIVEMSMRMIEPRALEGHLILVKNLPEHPPLIYADKRRMQQILVNLLSNAVKFTPPEGLVTLSILRNDNDSLTIRVTDTGVGMDEVGMAKALKPFGQVDSALTRQVEGTGLGLPLTRDLVESHGGEMVLQSVPGEGTTVSINLPKARVIGLDS